MLYELIDRKQFIEARYKRFQQNKPMLEQSGAIFTDLDRNYGDGLMKDVVICDRCNENILDHSFIMLERSRVYHLDCIRSELPKNMNLQNVVLVDFSKTRED